MFIEKIICGISSYSPYTLFLSENGEVYGCGKILSNKQLCPQKLTLKLNGKIQFVHTAFRNTFFINFDEKICICVNFSQPKPKITPIKLPNNRKIRSVITTNQSKKPLCFLTEDNSCIFLKRSENQEFLFSPLSLSLKKIKQISFGEAHTIFLTQNNKLYALGSNQVYALGIGNQDHLYCTEDPIEINSLQKKSIKKISVGRYHSIVLTYDNKAYGWGNNSHRQLGLSDQNDRATPTLINTLIGKKIKNIYAGGHQSFFLTTDNKIYACGSKNDGRLGICNFDNPKSPTVIDFFYKRGIKVIDIVCGWFQTFFITDQGKIYGCGSNEDGELGIGHTHDQCVPTLISNFKFRPRPQKDSFENKLLGKVKKRNYSDVLIFVE